MPAGTFNLFIEQGATFKLTISVTQGSTPTAMDLTGYLARMMIRSKVTDTTPVLSLDNGALGGLTLGGAAGTCNIVITDEQTAAIAISKGVYDLELESAAGEVIRLLKGSVTVDPEVTR